MNYTRKSFTVPMRGSAENWERTFGKESKLVPVKAVIFKNGMMMVFDKSGQQVPRYQGPVEEELTKLQRDYPECEVRRGDWEDYRP